MRHLFGYEFFATKSILLVMLKTAASRLSKLMAYGSRSEVASLATLSVLVISCKSWNAESEVDGVAAVYRYFGS